MPVVYRKRLDGPGTEHRTVFSADVRCYLDNGWSLNKPPIDYAPNSLGGPPIKVQQQSPYERRRSELEAMDWRQLKEISQSFDPPIDKPLGGWDDSVSEILAREGLQD